MMKTKFSHKVIAVFLALNFLQTFVPYNILLANNNGPNAPEAASFEPVEATDMVNLLSGDVSYVLPLLDMGGFPVTLSYHSGVPLNMESSWTGLGWNVNTGAINRGLSGTPDDWKNGSSLDFIYFRDSEEYYNINVGVGFSSAASAGVGFSWGSNKSLSGSVYGSVLGVNASISTDGGYSLGVGISKSGSNYGGSLSVSGNVNGGGISIGAGVGGSSSSGATGSLGFSISGQGASFSASAGYSNQTSYDKGQAGRGSVSFSNYSAGDFDISSKGFYVPINLGILNFGFGHQKVTYTLDKAYPKSGNGILYANSAANTDASIGNQDNFNDLQNRYFYSDLYEQTIPSTEEEFIGDYKTEREKTNFSFASYDSYEVNASGISGVLQPKVFQNATLFGEGYAGADTDDANRKMRIYYHNGSNSTKTFGTSLNNTSSDINFYFNGQFTDNVEIPRRNLTTSGLVDNFSDYLSGSYSINTRQRSGNFVEVFTNQQLVNNTTTEVMLPEVASYNNWPSEGIGAYKITAPDGKTYHYSLPVYHYEQVERNVIKDNSERNVNEKRQYTPYATHWLLTAITGPDFIDKNNNNRPDENDYGYWVRMDHGKWSDGFVWRSPYKGKKYNTNLQGEIEDKDFGNYQYGRKQLYYLDKIVTREYTSYFVKDIRYDATGAQGYNDYNNHALGFYNYSFQGANTIEDVVNGGDVSVRESITYRREYQLLLDKIIVVKNDDATIGKNQNPSSSLNKTDCFPDYNDDDTVSPGFNPQGGFSAEYGTNYSYQIHQESNVYDVTDFENFDFGTAFKVIDFNYDYSLAKNTPSSLHCNISQGGRLTLTGVYFMGKQNKQYMPPYRFDYKNEMDYPNELAFDKNFGNNLLPELAADEWGFIDEEHVAKNIYNSTDYKKYGPDNWSLTEITTPTGAKIKLEYEEDDYETEAFSRRLWQDNLQIAVKRGPSQSPNAYMYVFLQNVEGLRPELVTNFEDYFNVGEKVYLDLWIARTWDKGLFSGDRAGGVDFNTTYPYDIMVDEIRSDNTLVLKVYVDFSLSEGPGDHVIVKTPNGIFSDVDDDIHAVASPTGAFYNENEYRYFAKQDRIGSDRYLSLPRGKFIKEVGNGDDAHTMVYKLLANRIPKGVTGGGLRAKSITVSDGNGKDYKTNYYYNQPTTPRDRNNVNYVSSGITSFAPVNGIKFIPYQSELPSPGVMYEYVTMVPESSTGEELGSTRYRFHTLKPVFDVFDPNIEMKDDLGSTIFEANVTDHGNGDYFDASNKTYAKTIDLKVNTSLVGQFRSIESFNSLGHLMSKTERNYISGEAATAIPGRGSISESFQSMKSIFTTDNNDNNPSLKNRMISISSKEDYSSILTSVKTVSGGFASIEEYSDADPETGTFRTTKTTNADGTEVQTKNIAAYTHYPEMGSKVYNRNNKHMLTQEAATYTYLKDANNQWKEMSVGITTWNNNWNYRTYYGQDETPTALNEKIWRKHRTYTWRGNLNNDGTLQGYQDNFNWSLSATSQANEWQMISETSRYDHYSMPLELKDINNNFAATKMGDDESKVIAVGNAAYTELYYSGAENLHKMDNLYHDAEVYSLGQRTTSTFHTGAYSVATLVDKRGFAVGLNANEHRSGIYKTSVWAEKANAQNARIHINGETKSFNGEQLTAGDWVMLNHYEEISSDQEQIYVTSASGTVYFDDFRVHPVASSMTSYVYNEWDELAYIINSNNLATRYEYDVGGRLIRTYTEVVDTDVLTGGFKKISENRYNYKNL